AATPIQLARAIGAIASGGVLVRPHVTSPSGLPPNVVPASDLPQQMKIPIDPKNWEIITDAMANVPSALGTDGSAHLQRINFAGKTGSAQTVSNMLKAKTVNGKSKYKDNAWFVGVTPRRNPELVVAVLFEGGEHGQFAARLAAQVVKAYVDKQRKVPTKVAGLPSHQNTEIAGVWTGADGDDLQAGRMVFDLPA